MVRKFHNHKLQTNPWHCEEEPHSNHEALGKQTKQSNQISLPHLLALFLSLSLSLSSRFSLLAHLSTLYPPPLSLSLSLSVSLSTLYSILFVVLHSLFSLSLSTLSLSTLSLSLLCLPLYVCLYSLSLSPSLSLSLCLSTLSLSLSLYTLFSTCTPLYSLYT